MSSNTTVYLFPHILKCAGLSVRDYLLHDVPPRGSAVIYSKPEQRPWLDPVNRVPQADRDEIRILFGHRLPRTAARGFEGRVIREVGLLREPVSFYVSLYNFLQKTPERHRIVGMSFEQWYPTNKHNRISRFYFRHYFGLSSLGIRKMSQRQRFEFLSRQFETFWFVGDYRNCDAVMEQMTQDIGWKFEKLPHENAAPTNALRSQDIGEALRQKILQDNALDLALYETWAERKWGDNPTLERGQGLNNRWTWQ
ncbi:hypothetical protein RNI52_06860 [Labrys neptuniae]|uniref:hypothetical protein n=1 Tax=Labrys TaxID=204476 RepID=UPI0028906735|nr:hypothetical protein [Labrys neptuniae]MDT3377041.1 hypothetical protein [Labrys neptuniae]